MKKQKQNSIKQSLEKMNLLQARVFGRGKTSSGVLVNPKSDAIPKEILKTLKSLNMKVK